MKRGFKKLIGQRITAIDARSVNSVIITTEQGDKFEINSDDIVQSSLPIPVIRLVQLKADDKR